MNSELSKTLADCLAEIERGASVADCLKRHADQAAQLRPHLETWGAMGSTALVQPSTAAFNRGRQAMHSALASTPGGFGPFAALRMAPAWTTMAAAVAAAVIVLGGAAGASAALGGPNPAGDALDAVGVTGDGEGGISHSSASDRGLECANPNAFEGRANSEDKAQNAEDAHSKEKCSPGNCETEATGEDVDDEVETEEIEGDDADEDLDEESGGNGNGDANGQGNVNSNAGGNGNANANGQNNGQPCAEDGDGDGTSESEGGINNAPDNANNGKDKANENATEGSGNAEDGADNRNDNGGAQGDDAPGGPPEGQGGGQQND